MGPFKIAIASSNRIEDLKDEEVLLFAEHLDKFGVEWSLQDWKDESIDWSKFNAVIPLKI